MDSKLPVDCEHHLTQLFQTPELRTEIRAYLRYRLFTSLQNSSLGPCLARKDVQPISPKLQTLNLMVAEYLLRHRHHFTLSVFSCEVPSVSCLSPSLQDTMMGKTSSSAVPFKLEDLQDMLETLGVSPSSVEGQELQRRYLEHEQPLLVCLIRALRDLRKPPVVAEVQRRDEACNTEQEQNTLESFTKAHQRAIQQLESRYAEQVEHERKEWALQLRAQEKEQEQRSSRGAEEEQQLRELVASLQEQLAAAEQTLAEIRVQKSEEVGRVEEGRRDQESALEALGQKLQLRQISLAEEAARLERERAGLKKVKKKLQSQQRHLDEISLALVHSQDAVPPKSSLLPALEIQLQVKEAEVSELKAAATALQEENQSLRNLTEQQRNRISSLNVRMAELVAELHHCSRETVEVPRWTTWQARHRKSSGSDSSPTDDIVRDAKRRIKTLEEEFEAIGRYHKDFQVRHLNESLVSSVLGSSSSGHQLFTSHQSQASYQPVPSMEHSYLSQNLNQQSQRYTQAPPIPKLPKTRSPRQRVYSAETPKLVLQTPNPNIVNVENLRYTNFSENASKVSFSETRENHILPKENDFTQELKIDTSPSFSAKQNENPKPTSADKTSLKDLMTSMSDAHISSNTPSTFNKDIHEDLIRPMRNAQTSSNVPSNFNKDIHEELIGPMGDTQISSTFNKDIHKDLIRPMGDTKISSNFNKNVHEELIGPMGDAHLSSNFNKGIHKDLLGPISDAQMSSNDPSSFNKDIHKDLIGPMGDAQIPSERSIQVPEPSLNGLSAGVNGDSPSFKPELPPASVAPSTKGRQEQSQLSSSSSSKHISAGLASPREDEDDFWNL